MLILRDHNLDEQTDWEKNIFPLLIGNLYAVEQTDIDEKVIGWMIIKQGEESC